MKCIICYQKNIDSRLNTCYHEFCNTCIHKWFSTNYLNYNHYGYAKCPICRTWFLKKSIRKIPKKIKAKKKNIVFEKRITRTNTKEKRQFDILTFLNTSLDEIQSDEITFDEKIIIVNSVYKKLYDNKWFLYDGNQISPFGKVVYNKLCELEKTYKNDILELKIWKYKLRFLKT